MRNVFWPGRLLHISGERRQSVREVWREGAVDVRFQCTEVDFDDVVIMLLASCVGLEEVQVLACCGGDVASVCCGEVAAHRVGVWEDTRRRADFRGHVAHGGHGCCAQCCCARAKELENVAFATGDREEASDVKNDICEGRSETCGIAMEVLHGDSTFCARPPAELPSELDADDLWTLKFPRHVCHRIDGIGSTDTNAQHTHPSSVRCM